MSRPRIKNGRDQRYPLSDDEAPLVFASAGTDEDDSYNSLSDGPYTNSESSEERDSDLENEITSGDETIITQNSVKYHSYTESVWHASEPVNSLGVRRGSIDNSTVRCGTTVEPCQDVLSLHSDSGIIRNFNFNNSQHRTTLLEDRGTLLNKSDTKLYPESSPSEDDIPNYNFDESPQAQPTPISTVPHNTIAISLPQPLTSIGFIRDAPQSETRLQVALVSPNSKDPRRSTLVRLEQPDLTPYLQKSPPAPISANLSSQNSSAPRKRHREEQCRIPTPMKRQGQKRVQKWVEEQQEQSSPPAKRPRAAFATSVKEAVSGVWEYFSPK